MGLLLKDIIKIGASRLEKAGCSDPKLDAELLLCHMLGKDKVYLFMHWSDELADKQCDYYFDILETRAAGKPLQYITGKQEFMGLDFAVNESVLIPRQDTEILVEETIRQAYSAGKKHLKILDLCTGSGAIAISLDKYINGKNNDHSVNDIRLDNILNSSGNTEFTKKQKDKKLTSVEIIASDISPEALSVAKANAKTNLAKINFVEGDLFKPFEKRLLKPNFDIIVSNPPYIPSEVIEGLQVEVRDHEPRLALDGGADGLDCYRKIISQAKSFLGKKGQLLLEIGFDQAEPIRQLAQDQGYEQITVIKDLAGHDRVVVLGICKDELYGDL